MIAISCQGGTAVSHVATINVEIKSLDDLEAAAKSIGLELVRGQRTYRWYGRSVGDYPVPQGFAADELGTCDHAIRVPLSVDGADRCYEIGVCGRRDGKPGFVLLWDNWNSGKCSYSTGLDADEGRTDWTVNTSRTSLVQFVGDAGQKLTQSYARVAAIRAGQQQGFQVQEQRLADGSIRIVFQKG